MAFPSFANDGSNAVSKYHFPSLETQLFSDTFNQGNSLVSRPRLAKQHQHQHHGHSRTPDNARHVHFNEYNGQEAEQRQELEVSCEQNPTQLFLLMDSQLWDRALMHLRDKPIEAHVWISSFFPDSDEYKWCNLPLHLACLYGPEPAPLAFMEGLITTYPGAAQCRNHEGNLPIHLACECMDLSPKFGLEVEGILVALIKAFPECLSMRDSRGRRPIDILEEKGIRALKTENIVGRGIGIVKYMKTQARSMGLADVEQRHERDAHFTDGEARSRRRPRNVETAHNRKASITAHRGETMKSRDRARSISMKELTNVEVPDRRDDATAHKREKMESRDNSKSNSTLDERQQDPPIAEAPDPSLLSNTLEDSSEDQCSFDSPRKDRQAIEQHLLQPYDADPTIGAFNHVSAVSPNEDNTLQSTTEHFDPFHQLDTELNSMRAAHQSMSQLLNIKSQRESELQEHLGNVETKCAQVEKEHARLSDEHAGTLAELREKTKALENSVYEIKVIKSKERAISSELALKMKVEGDLHIELKQLKSELATVKEARNLAMEKLDYQTKMSADYKEMMAKSKITNEKLATENEEVSRENKEMRSQLAETKKLLQDAKRKESTLLEMLSKMHTSDDFECAMKKVKSENEKLSKANEELAMQLVQQNHQLEETRAVESEWKTTALENEELMTKIEDLETRFSQKEEEVRKTKIKESRLEEQLRNVSETNTPEAQELSAQNLALRAIVGILQKRVQRIPQSNDESKEDLKQKIAEVAPSITNRVSNSPKVFTGKSLELLHPITTDAQNLQEDTIDCIQGLLQQTYDTMDLTEKISSTPNLAFEPTLHILEDIITTHVHILETLGTVRETKESCKSKMTSLLNNRPIGKTSSILPQSKKINHKNEAPSHLAISTIRKHTTKMSSITLKHVEKMESLSRTVGKLPQMRRIDVGLHKNDLRKHLSMVDEIASVLQKALLRLVHDAKRINYQCVQLGDLSATERHLKVFR